MSKIGNAFLELQEQANELGFETVEDAIRNGIELTIDGVSNAPYNILLEWELEKNIIELSKYATSEQSTLLRELSKKLEEIANNL